MKLSPVQLATLQEAIESDDEHWYLTMCVYPRTFGGLARHGLIASQGNTWAVTDAGRQAAENVKEYPR